ncbi:CusA/CzcA family heavy metal efflux RND transporter [uncultured Dechloromonas sp.]|uniref:efflux RND transporter permease subunit n=1 Tax=uncultured Dechloromonas sp. TaxID=171719 RepID=UPI0025ED7C50|nr:CusA/CzcA family heavy metal efflux RND transporter [uncultured Dechloromonas sp.]
MLPRFSTFVIRQRMFILVMAVALAVIGFRALQDLPVEAFPDVQDVQVQVVTQYPGQSPEEVERNVSIPVEREMSGVPRATQVRSVSITGLSVVTLTFSEGTNDYFARNQVLEKLQNVAFPPGIQPQLAPLATAVGEVYRYVLSAPADMPPREVRALQDWVVRPALRRVAGVADINSFGGAVKEYQVRVNPPALMRYGITLDQVSQALASGNQNASGGLMKRGDESLVVRAVGLFGSLDDIRATVITAKEGKTVTIGDVADVSVGDRPLSGIVANDEQDSVVEGIILMTKGGDPSKVVADVLQRVDELNGGQLPKGVSIKPIYQRTELVKHTVHTVIENLLAGALLVVSVLVIFLREWRAAMVVAAIIPLTLLFAFTLMDLKGVPANLISLGTVDFGIIIDSAVVLVEALMVRLAVHQPTAAIESAVGRRFDALRWVTSSLTKPILFSKAIIILAFLPIFTFQRVEGRIFAPVALILSFSLIGAVLFTLTVVPALLSLVLAKHDLAEKHIDWLAKLQRAYRRLLMRCQRAPRQAFGIGGLIALLAFGLIPVLGSEFLPRLDEGNLWLTITLPPGSSLEQSKDVERAVRATLRTYPEVKMLVTQVGRPDDGTDPKGPNNIEILADLQPRGDWRFADKEALVADMSNKLKAIPGLPTNFSQVIQDNVEEALSGVKGEIAIKVFGPDLEILQDKAEQIAGILRTIQGSRDVAAILPSGQPEVAILPNRVKMARLGLSMADLDNAVQTALGGSAVGGYYEGERRFDVVLRFAAPYRNSVEDVGAVPVALPNNAGTVRIADVATVEVREGASRISREAGGRNVSVKANLQGRDQGSFVDEAMAKVGSQVQLPAGYRIVWGGQFENQQRAMKRLAVIVPASLFGIFALLFWAFRSIRLAGLILAMLPFNIAGGFFALGLAGLHLSISAAVGFIAVAGISVQNGVIMVEEIVRLVDNGSSLVRAITEGAVSRLRPILMTALMAGLGLLPAALSNAIGAETQRPFAVVIVGGVVTATLFTLTLLPPLAWWGMRHNGRENDEQ